MGDVIAVTRLGYSIVSALKDSGGSVEQWRKLDTNINRFSEAISKAHGLYSTCVSLGELDAVATTIIQDMIEALKICSSSVDDFRAEMEPYKAAFEGAAQAGKSGRAMTEITKLKFVFDKLKAVEAFGNALENGIRLYKLHASRLESYLLQQAVGETRKISRGQNQLMEIITAIRAERNEVTKTLFEGRNQQAQILQKVEHIADELVQLRQSVQMLLPQMLATMTEALERSQRNLTQKTTPSPNTKEAISRTTFREHTSVSATVLIPFALALAFLARLHEFLRAHLPRKIKHTWETWSTLSNSIMLKDATGQDLIFQIPMCNTLEDLHSLLDIRFRRHPGYKFISSRRYKIFADDTKQDILSEKRYSAILSPGRRLTMSVEAYTGRTNSTLEMVGGTCLGCQMRFRLIVRGKRSEGFKVDCEYCGEDIDCIKANPWDHFDSSARMHWAFKMFKEHALKEQQIFSDSLSIFSISHVPHQAFPIHARPVSHPDKTTKSDVVLRTLRTFNEVLRKRAPR